MTDESMPTRPLPQRARRTKRAPAPEFGNNAYVDTTAVLHQARVIAMQTLFEMDSAQHDVDDLIDRLYDTSGELPESVLESLDEDESDVDDIPAPVADHAAALIRGVTHYMPEIDPVIEKAAPAYPMAQIAMVDRNVLRLAIYELTHEPKVPYKVVINEAVEIAKRYGGPSSGKFVNGVLGTVARDLPAQPKSRRKR